MAFREEVAAIQFVEHGRRGGFPAEPFSRIDVDAWQGPDVQQHVLQPLIHAVKHFGREKIEHHALALPDSVGRAWHLRFLGKNQREPGRPPVATPEQPFGHGRLAGLEFCNSHHLVRRQPECRAPKHDQPVPGDGAREVCGRGRARDQQQAAVRGRLVDRAQKYVREAVRIQRGLEIVDDHDGSVFLGIEECAKESPGEHGELMRMIGQIARPAPCERRFPGQRAQVREELGWIAVAGVHMQPASRTLALVEVARHQGGLSRTRHTIQPKGGMLECFVESFEQPLPWCDVEQVGGGQLCKSRCIHGKPAHGDDALW